MYMQSSTEVMDISDWKYRHDSSSCALFSICCVCFHRECSKRVFFLNFKFTNPSFHFNFHFKSSKHNPQSKRNERQQEQKNQKPIKNCVYFAYRLI